jgi:phage terminase large subunit-like protein
MVESIIRQTDAAVSYTAVRASRGKRIRAEPIKALYEQGRVHHVGNFDELEAEMVQWVPDESEWSPNRLDALVWALTDLAGGRILDGDMMV